MMCMSCIETGSFILDWLMGDLFIIYRGILKRGNHFHILLMPIAVEESSEQVATVP